MDGRGQEDARYGNRIRWVLNTELHVTELTTLACPDGVDDDPGEPAKKFGSAVVEVGARSTRGINVSGNC